MTNSLAAALDRTLLLMRDNLTAAVSDAELVEALRETTVALIGNERNLETHSAQCAYVTAALLMARSAHRVFLVAPDVPLVGPQPPLTGTRLISALIEVGRDLLPDIEFSVGMPAEPVHVAVFFGDSDAQVTARRTICANATAWSAQLSSRGPARPWQASAWPCGGLAAGALAATEVFKDAMLRLREFANDGPLFDALFAPVGKVNFELAPAGTPQDATLGDFDLISGGAITHAALFALARLPRISGLGRVMDPESTELSNLNRYSLLRRSIIDQPKVSQLKTIVAPQLELEPIAARFQRGQDLADGLRPSVLVGVDDIPVRWWVQEAVPAWLGIGATTHWCGMASFHQRGLGCARCLHPRDDADQARIPTAPFVSFLAGLHLACYFARASAGEVIPASEQYVYFSPLRPERVWRSAVARRPTCPICNAVMQAA